MDTRKSPHLEVIRDAERIVYREKWRICEDRAAEQLADTSSLRWTRLFPESPVIQVVAIDGVVVGPCPAQQRPMDRDRNGPAGSGRRLRHLPRRPPGPGLRNAALVNRVRVSRRSQ
jgi:hypothetical protein